MTTHLTPDELSEIDACIECSTPVPPRLAAKMRTHIAGRDDMVAALERMLRDCVVAMETWGSWEDGVPDSDQKGEYGFVGKAYDNARVALFMGDPDGKRNAAIVRAADKLTAAERRAAQLERDLDDANTTIAALREACTWNYEGRSEWGYTLAEAIEHVEGKGYSCLTDYLKRIQAALCKEATPAPTTTTPDALGVRVERLEKAVMAALVLAARCARNQGMHGRDAVAVSQQWPETIAADDAITALEKP